VKIFNLVIKENTRDLKLDDIIKTAENEIKTVLPLGKIIESKKKKDDSGEYYSIIYSGGVQGYNLMFEQHSRIIGKEIFTLTFTSETTQWKSARKTAEDILESFSYSE
jgi:hypothetical protein